jgi:arylsulfatase A
VNHFLCFVACVFSNWLLLSCTASAQAVVDQDLSRPNVVFILADDMGYGDVSALNEKAAWRTPHMDRLAKEGMTFTDAHSGSGVCTPTRYGVITGRYAWRSRLKRGVLGGASAHLINPERMTVASYLQKQGYHTACIGKWHLGMDFGKDGKQIDFTKPVANGPSANGFDYYYCHNGSLDMAPYVYVENGRVTAVPDRTTVNKDYQGFWRKGKTGADFDHDDVLPNFTRRAVAHIAKQARRSTPFFLYLALPAPHTPILPTKEFRGKSKTNPYGDFVLQVDDTVGRVAEALEKAGVADNTLLIVTADNGCSPRARFEELKEFGHDPSYVFRGHKADIYEGGHRVPFVARWPLGVEAGSQSKSTTCLTDLMRTCADIVGQPLPDSAGEDSVSFLPALRGQQGQLREATVHHSINGSFAIRSGKWKLCLCPGSGGWSSPKPAAAFKSGGPLVQLFDLDQDLGETNNLADKKPEVVTRMSDLLARYVARGRSTPGVAQKNQGKTPFLPKGYAGSKPAKRGQRRDK